MFLSNYSLHGHSATKIRWFPAPGPLRRSPPAAETMGISRDDWHLREAACCALAFSLNCSTPLAPGAPFPMMPRYAMVSFRGQVMSGSWTSSNGHALHHEGTVQVATLHLPAAAHALRTDPMHTRRAPRSDADPVHFFPFLFHSQATINPLP